MMLPNVATTAYSASRAVIRTVGRWTQVVEGEQRSLRPMLVLMLMVAGFVLFVLAALSIPVPRVHLGWAGMACLTLAYLLGHAH